MTSPHIVEHVVHLLDEGDHGDLGDGGGSRASGADHSGEGHPEVSILHERPPLLERRQSVQWRCSSAKDLHPAGSVPDLLGPPLEMRYDLLDLLGP